MMRRIKKLIRNLINLFGYDIHRIPARSRHGILSYINNYQKFHKYKNKHEHQRCIIIGNGPSLNETNLDLLENEIAFGLNKIYLLFPKLSWRPTYVVSYVPDVIQQSKNEFEKLSMPLFVSNEGRPLLETRNYETLSFGDHKRFSFSLNPPQEICVGHTVTYVTMQLALYMGFEQVILIGVDHNFNYEGPTDTWHTIKEPAKRRHFSNEYFAPGQTWQSPNLKMAEAHYAFAKMVYERFDKEIIDCTVNGDLQVFRKEKLEDILR